MKPTREKLAAHAGWKRRRARRALPVNNDLPTRPLARAECLPGGRNAARPCPYVSCRYHLLLDVRRTGSIKLNFRTSDVTRLSETCALDVAERGAHSLDQLGRLMGVTRERVRQIADYALARAKRILSARGGV